MTRQRHDIAVVGGGVVGTATALALVRKGFDVVLLERGVAPPAFDPTQYDARVYAIAPGMARFLDTLGVWARVAAQRVSPYDRMRVWEQSPLQALTFDAAEFAVPELGFIVEDALLRDVLWRALGGASVRTGARVTGLASADDGARLTLEGGDVIEAALVVAAEGGDSPLREWAGIEPVGWSYAQRAIVCHVTTQSPHRRTAYQRFLPEGPLAFLPLADGRSSIVWSATASAAEALLALDDAAFRERLANAGDNILGDITAATPRSAFPLRLLHAETYVRPGLALVGDSAHVIHPMAGQGLNLGLADAQALVEVVAEARAARRPPGALRTLQRYARRRRADNAEALALTEGLHRLFGARLPALEVLRGFGLSLAGRAGPVKRALAQRAMGL